MTSWTTSSTILVVINSNWVTSIVNRILTAFDECKRGQRGCLYTVTGILLGAYQRWIRPSPYATQAAPRKQWIPWWEGPRNVGQTIAYWFKKNLQGTEDCKIQVLVQIINHNVTRVHCMSRQVVIIELLALICLSQYVTSRWLSQILIYHPTDTMQAHIPTAVQDCGVGEKMICSAVFYSLSSYSVSTAFDANPVILNGHRVVPSPAASYNWRYH